MNLAKAITGTLGFGSTAEAGRTVPLGTHRQAADRERPPRVGGAHGDVERSAADQTYPGRFDVCHWSTFLDRFSRGADCSRNRVSRYRQRTYPARRYQRLSYLIVDQILPRA